MLGSVEKKDRPCAPQMPGFMHRVAGGVNLLVGQSWPVFCTDCADVFCFHGRSGISKLACSYWKGFGAERRIAIPSHGRPSAADSPKAFWG